MTIEILKSDKPIVVESTSPDWIRAAILFMTANHPISPDRVILLDKKDGTTCTLRTFNNPNSRDIDTVGRIEIRQEDIVTESFTLDAKKPLYVVGSSISNDQIAIDKIIRYRPFNHR